MMNEFIRVARILNLRYGTASVPSLVFMTDRHRVVNVEQVLQALPAKSLVIIRDYDHPDRAHYAKHLVQICRKRKLYVLIAGDPRLALQLKADGLHIPEGLLQQLQHWRQKHPKWIITTSAHSLRAARYAARHHLTSIILSPIFPTASHPERRSLGKIGVNTIGREIRCYKPHLIVLGGLYPHNIRTIMHCNCSGFAIMSGAQATSKSDIFATNIL